MYVGSTVINYEHIVIKNIIVSLKKILILCKEYSTYIKQSCYGFVTGN